MIFLGELLQFQTVNFGKKKSWKILQVVLSLLFMTRSWFRIPVFSYCFPCEIVIETNCAGKMKDQKMIPNLFQVKNYNQFTVTLKGTKPKYIRSNLK